MGKGKQVINSILVTLENQGGLKLSIFLYWIFFLLNQNYIEYELK